MATEQILVDIRTRGGERVAVDLREIEQAFRRAQARAAEAGRVAPAGLRAIGAVAGDVRARVDGVAGSLGVLGSALRALGPSGVVVGATIAGLGAVAAAATRAARAASEITDAAARLGVSTTLYQQLGFAAEQTGVRLDTVVAGIQRFRRALAEIEQRGPASALAKLDAAFATQLTRARDLDEAFGLFAARVRAATTANEQVALAVAAFGRQGAAILPMLTDMDASFAELAAEAQRLGIVLDEGLLVRGDRAADAVARLASVLRAQLLGALAELAPMLEDAATRLADLAGAVGRVWRGVGTGGPDLRSRQGVALQRALRAEQRRFEVLRADVARMQYGEPPLVGGSPEALAASRQRIRALAEQLKALRREEAEAQRRARETRRLFAAGADEDLDAASADRTAARTREATRTAEAAIRRVAQAHDRAAAERERVLERLHALEERAALAPLEGIERVRAEQAQRFAEWEQLLADMPDREALLARARVAIEAETAAEIAAIRRRELEAAARDAERLAEAEAAAIGRLMDPLTTALDEFQRRAGQLVAGALFGGRQQVTPATLVRDLGQQLASQLVAAVLSSATQLGVQHATRIAKHAMLGFVVRPSTTATTGATTAAGTAASGAAAAAPALGSMAAAGGYLAAIIGAVVNSALFARMRVTDQYRLSARMAMAGVFPPVATALFALRGQTRASILTGLFPFLLPLQAAGVDVLGLAPDRTDYQRALWDRIRRQLRARQVAGARALGPVAVGRGVTPWPAVGDPAIALGAIVAGMRGGGGEAVFGAAIAAAIDRAGLGAAAALRALAIPAREAFAAIQRTFDGGRRQAETYARALRGLVEVYGRLRSAARDAALEILRADGRLSGADLQALVRARRRSAEILAQALGGGDVVRGLGTGLTEAIGETMARALREQIGEGILALPLLALRGALRAARRRTSPGGREITADEQLAALEAALGRVGQVGASLGDAARVLDRAMDAGAIVAAALQASAGDLGAAAETLAARLAPLAGLRDAIRAAATEFSARIAAMLTGVRGGAIADRLTLARIGRAEAALRVDPLIGPLLPGIQAGWLRELLPGTRFTAATPAMLEQALRAVGAYLDARLEAAQRELDLISTLRGAYADASTIVRDLRGRIDELLGATTPVGRTLEAWRDALADWRAIDLRDPAAVTAGITRIQEALGALADRYALARQRAETFGGLAEQAFLARGGPRATRRLLAERRRELAALADAARTGDALAVERAQSVMTQILALAGQLGGGAGRRAQREVEQLAGELAREAQADAERLRTEMIAAREILHGIGASLDGLDGYLRLRLDTVATTLEQLHADWAAVLETLERSASAQLASAITRLNELLADGPESLRDVLRQIALRLGNSTTLSAGPTLGQRATVGRL